MTVPRFFVVGARGYIGAALAAAIPTSESCVMTSSTPEGGLVRLRLECPEDFGALHVGLGDVLFVTAAISAPDVCAREHERAYRVNVTGTSALVEYAIARGARVIFFSSDTVYGERRALFDEQAPCDPAGEYAAMKHEVESRFAGNPAFKSIRLSYVFSREDKFTKYLSGCAQRGDEAELFHPFHRAVVYREDVITGALALARHWDEFPQPIVNFAGPNVLSRIEFGALLQCIAFPSLRLRTTEPEQSFFNNRPRIIAMSSNIFPLLLGRPPMSLEAAVQKEFSLVGVHRTSSRAQG